MKNIVIRVTGNNRKAVLAFLDKHMLPSHKPSNVSGLLVSKENCYIIITGNTFETHFKYNGPTMTLKQVRELYEPKQTENEKRLQGRASMYKLKYEKCKEYSLEKEDIIDSLNKDVVYLMGLNNELEKANKNQVKRYEKLQNELNTHKEKVTKLTQERDTHLQLNSELRVTNTRLTDELIELEGKHHDLWARNQKIDEELVIQCSKNYDLHKRIKSSEFELDQSLQTNQKLIKEKYRYIAMIVLLTLTVITLCVLN